MYNWRISSFPATIVSGLRGGLHNLTFSGWEVKRSCEVVRMKKLTANIFRIQKLMATFQDEETDS
jgi:hypothetical protein